MLIPVKYLHHMLPRNGAAATYETYFFDTYDGDEAGDIATPRSNQPVGDSDIIQLDDTGWSIVSGKLNVAQEGATPSNGELEVLVDALFDRVAGLAYKVKVNKFDSGGILVMGFSVAADSNRRGASFLWRNGPEPRVYEGTAAVTGFNNVSTGVEYSLAVVLQLNRAFYLIKGGAFTDWTLHWVGRSWTTTEDIIACISPSTPNASDKFDDLWVGNLLGNWAVEGGLRTDSHPDSVSAPTTFVHDADFVLQVNVGTISATAKVIKFRIQDANNYWQITLDTTSSDLDEVVSGTPTQRATGAAMASSSVATLTAVGSTIRLWDDNSRIHNYASATNFQTETDGEFTSGANVTDMFIYPRTFPTSGNDGAILDSAGVAS